MKKIGCVIAYKKNHNNYGTSLQGYAMLKKIQQLGYEVEVINYVKRLSFIEKVRIAVSRLRLLGVLGFIKHIKKNKMPQDAKYANNLKLRTAAVNAYKEKKLVPLFHDYVGYTALHNGSRNYDTIVVGSDQVW